VTNTVPATHVEEQALAELVGEHPPEPACGGPRSPQVPGSFIDVTRQALGEIGIIERHLKLPMASVFTGDSVCKATELCP
jgi:hypothetical protein